MTLELDEGLSTELPYEDGSFDLVLSTLFFHHLDPEPKRRSARRSPACWARAASCT